MALQLNLQVSESEIYPEAYAHIVYVRSEAKETYIFVNIFKNREERIASCTPVPREQMKDRPRAFRSMEYIIPSEQFGPGTVYPTAYAYLKSLPEFAESIDLLDPIIPDEQML